MHADQSDQSYASSEPGLPEVRPSSGVSLRAASFIFCQCTFFGLLAAALVICRTTFKAKAKTLEWDAQEASGTTLSVSGSVSPECGRWALYIAQVVNCQSWVGELEVVDPLGQKITEQAPQESGQVTSFCTELGHQWRTQEVKGGGGTIVLAAVFAASFEESSDQPVLSGKYQVRNTKGKFWIGQLCDVEGQEELASVFFKASIGCGCLAALWSLVCFCVLCCCGVSDMTQTNSGMNAAGSGEGVPFPFHRYCAESAPHLSKSATFSQSFSRAFTKGLNRFSVFRIASSMSQMPSMHTKSSCGQTVSGQSTMQNINSSKVKMPMQTRAPETPGSKNKKNGAVSFFLPPPGEEGPYDEERPKAPAVADATERSGSALDAAGGCEAAPEAPEAAGAESKLAGPGSPVPAKRSKKRRGDVAPSPPTRLRKQRSTGSLDPEHAAREADSSAFSGDDSLEVLRASGKPISKGGVSSGMHKLSKNAAHPKVSSSRKADVSMGDVPDASGLEDVRSPVSSNLTSEQTQAEPIDMELSAGEEAVPAADPMPSKKADVGNLLPGARSPPKTSKASKKISAAAA